MTRRELLAGSPGLTSCFVNCSSSAPKKVTKQPPEPVTGLHALYQMYAFARTWAQDLKVIRLSSPGHCRSQNSAGQAARLPRAGSVLYPKRLAKHGLIPFPCTT